MSYKRSHDVRDAVANLAARHLFSTLPVAEWEVRALPTAPCRRRAYRPPFLTNAAPTAALAPWLEHYNT